MVRVRDALAPERVSERRASDWGRNLLKKWRTVKELILIKTKTEKVLKLKC